MISKRKLLENDIVILGIEIFITFLILYNYTSLELYWVIVLSTFIGIIFGHFVFLFLGLLISLILSLIQAFVVKYRKHPWIMPLYQYCKPVTLKDVWDPKDKNSELQ